MNVIDALGDVREEIRVLKAREQQLRQQLLGCGRNDERGARFRVRIEERPQRRFIKEKLPLAILQDPNFWQNEMRTFVRITSLPTAAKLPVPDVRRRITPPQDDDDDFDVIED